VRISSQPISTERLTDVSASERQALTNLKELLVRRTGVTGP
jgi:hypothetical protein